ncbi:hypothetical protein YC2023_111392 [Brassica napus]
MVGGTAAHRLTPPGDADNMKNDDSSNPLNALCNFSCGGGVSLKLRIHYTTQPLRGYSSKMSHRRISSAEKGKGLALSAHQPPRSARVKVPLPDNTELLRKHSLTLIGRECLVARAEAKALKASNEAVKRETSTKEPSSLQPPLTEKIIRAEVAKIIEISSLKDIIKINPNSGRKKDPSAALLKQENALLKSKRDLHILTETTLNIGTFLNPLVRASIGKSPGEARRQKTMDPQGLKPITRQQVGGFPSKLVCNSELEETAIQMVRASLSTPPEGPHGLSNATPDRVPATQRLGSSPYHPPTSSGKSLESQANSRERLPATLRLGPQTSPREGANEANATTPTEGSGDRVSAQLRLGPCVNVPTEIEELAPVDAPKRRPGRPPGRSGKEPAKPPPSSAQKRRRTTQAKGSPARRKTPSLVTNAGKTKTKAGTSKGREHELSTTSHH